MEGRCLLRAVVALKLQAIIICACVLVLAAFKVRGMMLAATVSQECGALTSKHRISRQQLGANLVKALQLPWWLIPVYAQHHSACDRCALWRSYWPHRCQLCLRAP